MKTLKDTFATIEINNYFSTNANQNVEIKKQIKGQDGSDMYLVEFFATTGHPGETIGETVVVIEDNMIAEIDNSYIHMF
jgi:hypothetical protein